ncbi:hypothetical protein FF100_18850 [Methylobacterium terricola]|uniref:TniQ domain-containing protein n=1 Tax=Methylobacterium terricola TaxID=2583531 RepID=A0A5C4LFA1_9HYPH|nr:TniQ family protein [Methylobacterium terricola]TNC11696.1 hypothetical protein FF100_18850 [Methylobacterium terricola]
MTSAPIEPLRWKLPPHPREPAVGYAARLAALNGLDMNFLVRANGLYPRGIYNGHDREIDGVAALGSLDQLQLDALRHHTPRRQSDGLFTDLQDVRLARGTLLSGYYRFCPHCIRQDLVEPPHDVPAVARPWLRVEWMVDQVRSCPEHGVYLAETSRADCRGSVADFSQDMRIEVLPNIRRLCSVAEPADPNAFEEWVLRRIGGELDASNWLNEMPLHAAMVVCEAIGIEFAGVARSRLRSLAGKERAAVWLTGYHIAAEGRPAIERFLSTLVERSHGVGQVGMMGIYGHILRILERNAEDPGFDAFREVVRGHIIENVPLPGGSLVLGQVLERRRLHTATSAAAASRTTRPTLKVIFARAGLGSALSAPGRSRLTIRVDEFDHLLRDFGEAMSFSEVQAATGIPKKHLVEFVAQGLLPTLFASTTVRRARHRVPRAKLAGFMETLLEGSVSIERPHRGQRTIGRACFAASTNCADLVRMILEGQLTWKGRLRDGRRYDDLLVDVDEVISHLQRDARPRTGLMLKELATEVRGLSFPTMRALIATGHLTVAQEFCPVFRRHIPVVTRDSVEAFRARYVTLSELGRLQGRDPRLVRSDLKRAGRKPAFEVSEIDTWIYLREDLSHEEASTKE